MTSMSAAGILLGCATNPATGRSQLILVPEKKEISIDCENFPHQFSAYYGKLQYKQLDAYLPSNERRIKCKKNFFVL